MSVVNVFFCLWNQLGGHPGYKKIEGPLNHHKLKQSMNINSVVRTFEWRYGLEKGIIPLLFSKNLEFLSANDALCPLRLSTFQSPIYGMNLFALWKGHNCSCIIPCLSNLLHVLFHPIDPLTIWLRTTWSVDNAEQTYKSSLYNFSKREVKHTINTKCEL